MTAALTRRLCSAAAFALPLLLYALTAHRFVGYWDIGEMDTVPYIAGIAHPPGLALYTMAGFCFSHVFALGSVAWRMSVLSAVYMSVAAWSVYAIVETLAGVDLAAVLAALLFATGGIAWNVATRADVHAMAAAFFGLALLAAIRWYLAPSPSRLALAAVLFGLGVAVHPVVLFLAPALLVILIARLHETETLPLLRATGLAILAYGLPLLYLPLRSAFVRAHGLDPVAGLGIPGSAFWDYGHPATFDGFRQLVFASGVDVSGALQAYDSDAYLGRALGMMHRFIEQGMYVGTMFAAIGLWMLARTKRALAIALAAAAIAPALFAAGFSDESDPARYLLPTLLIACALAGFAVASAPRAVARITGSVALVAAVAVALAAFPGRWYNAGDRSALDAANAILSRTPSDAIVVADWIVAPPLAYRAYVDRASGSRTIVAAWYFEVGDLLPRWIAHRPVYVAGTPEGSVDGFRLERVSANPDVYEVKREPSPR